MYLFQHRVRQFQQQDMLSVDLSQICNVVQAWHAMMRTDQSRTVADFAINLKTCWDASSKTEFEKCNYYKNELIALLIEDGGGCALVASAETQSERVMYILLQHHAPVDFSNAKGVTALMYTAHFGNMAMCNLLIGRRANLNAECMMVGPRNEPCAVTPLFAAMLNGHEDVMRRLIEAGARAQTCTGTDHDVQEYVYDHMSDLMPLVNSRTEDEKELEEPPRKRHISGNNG